MTKKLSIEDLAKEIRIIDFNIRTYNKPEDSKERDIYLTNRYCMDLAQGLVRYLTTLQKTFTEMKHNKECPSLQNHPVCTCEKFRRFN